MPHHVVRVTGAVFALALAAGACSDSSDYAYVAPASVEEVETGLWQIELTERGAERTGMETGEVTTESVGGTEQLALPYSAVIYHFDGSTWTYTNPRPLIYVRAPIDIDYIEGEMAFLADGPDVGTTVVSVGAAELYGVEFGIGK